MEDNNQYLIKNMVNNININIEKKLECIESMQKYDKVVLQIIYLLDEIKRLKIKKLDSDTMKRLVYTYNENLKDTKDKRKELVKLENETIELKKQLMIAFDKEEDKEYLQEIVDSTIDLIDTYKKEFRGSIKSK